MAKNFLLDARSEQRYNDLVIVCNVLISSHIIDYAGLRGGVHNAQDCFEAAEENMDRTHLRRGVVGKLKNPKVSFGSFQLRVKTNQTKSAIS